MVELRFILFCWRFRHSGEAKNIINFRRYDFIFIKLLLMFEQVIYLGYVNYGSGSWAVYLNHLLLSYSSYQSELWPWLNIDYWYVCIYIFSPNCKYYVRNNSKWLHWYKGYTPWTCLWLVMCYGCLVNPKIGPNLWEGWWACYGRANGHSSQTKNYSHEHV